MLTFGECISKLGTKPFMIILSQLSIYLYSVNILFFGDCVNLYTHQKLYKLSKSPVHFLPSIAQSSIYTTFF